MNKSELIDAIAASADIPKAAAGRALDAVIESVTGARPAAAFGISADAAIASISSDLFTLSPLISI